MLTPLYGRGLLRYSFLICATYSTFFSVDPNDFTFAECAAIENRLKSHLAHVFPTIL